MPDEILSSDAPETAIAPEPTTTVDDNKLLLTLNKERAAREQAEKDAKAAAAREAQVLAKLDEYKQIEPEKYHQLLEADRLRQEEALIRKNEYETLKARNLSEVEAARKEAIDYKTKHDNLLIKTAFENAFYAQGGQPPMAGSLEGEIISPVQTALASLQSRIRLRDGVPEVLDFAGQVELNATGKPKSLQEKIQELKQTSWGFFFKAENNASGSGMSPSYGAPPAGVRAYSAEAARQGKVPMEDIVSGKAVII